MTALGVLKYTAVLSPLFSAFGPEPIRERLALGDAAVLVTTPEFYRAQGGADPCPAARVAHRAGDWGPHAACRHPSSWQTP